MSVPLGFVLFALLLGALVMARSPLLFSGRFDRGRFCLVRGRCPGRLLAELSDVGRLERLDGIGLSVRSSGGRPKLDVSGSISKGQRQQLNNVVFRFEVSQIRLGR